MLILNIACLLSSIHYITKDSYVKVLAFFGGCHSVKHVPDKRNENYQ